MKKKILFVINTLGRAGAETALITLLKKLPENVVTIYGQITQFLFNTE